MTVNGDYALYFTKHVSFGAHQENLKEDTCRPTLLAAKCSLRTLVSGNVKFMRNFADIRGVSWKGAYGKMTYCYDFRDDTKAEQISLR